MYDKQYQTSASHCTVMKTKTRMCTPRSAKKMVATIEARKTVAAGVGGRERTHKYRRKVKYQHHTYHTVIRGPKP